MGEFFSTYHIVYQDEESDEVAIIETTSLMSESEAKRIAKAWSACAWTPGRKFKAIRLEEPDTLAKVEILDKLDPDAA